MKLVHGLIQVVIKGGQCTLLISPSAHFVMLPFTITLVYRVGGSPSDSYQSVRTDVLKTCMRCFLFILALIVSLTDIGSRLYMGIVAALTPMLPGPS